MRNKRDRPPAPARFRADADGRTRHTPRRCRDSLKNACDRSASCPAPEIPDLASITISPVEHARLSKRFEREQRGCWITARDWRRGARRVWPRGSARSVRRPVQRPSPVAGYHRSRCAASRRRKAPDRSITRTPRSTSAGARSRPPLQAARERPPRCQSASLSRGERLDHAVPDLASAGSSRGGPSGDEDMAAVTRASGWPASHRSSSWPA